MLRRPLWLWLLLTAPLCACDDEGEARPDARVEDAAPEDAAPGDVAVEDAALEDVAVEDAAVDAVIDALPPDAALDCAAAEAPLQLGEERGLICATLTRLYTLPAGVMLVITPSESLSWAAWADDVALAGLDPIGPFEAEAQIKLELRSGEAETSFQLHAYARFEATVEGVVRYEDMPYDPDGFTGARELRPARGVEVIIEREGEIVERATTDEAGAFQLEVRYETHAGYSIYAQAALRASKHSAEVRDLPGNLYALEPAPLELSPSERAAALELVGEGPINGALNITDVLWEAMETIAPFCKRGAPLLTMRWEDGQPFPCGSCFTGDEILVGGQVEDPDQFDDDIILHEFGHYFVRYHSADSSPGGSHRDRLVSPALAYGEGLAYVFAGVVRGSPHIVDNFIDDHRHIDMERVTLNGEALDELSGTTDGTLLGDLREELVEGVLWDAYDPANEPWDEVALGQEGMLKLWTRYFNANQPEIDLGAPGIDLVDWLNVVACQEDNAAELEALTAEREFPWSVDEVRCQKGDPPLVLRQDLKGIYLDDALEGARVWRGPLARLPEPPKRPRFTPIEGCEAPPCRLGAPLGGGEALILIGRGAHGRRSGSLLGEKARVARRGGRVDARRRLRVYPRRR